MRKSGILGVLLLCLIVVFPFAKNEGKNYMAVKAGSALYALGGFEEAGVVFKDITKKCRGSSCATGRYNLGNTLYFRGEITSDEEKIALWREAVDAYESALGFEKNDNYRTKIEHNKKVVEEKLEELGVSSEQDENQEEESEQGDEGEQGGDQGENQESEEGEQTQQEQGESQSGSEGEERSESASTEGGTLSESQRQQLEQYQELLEQQQQQNQEFFAPIPSSMQEQPQSLLDQFFGGDRLQKSLPKGGGVDW